MDPDPGKTPLLPAVARGEADAVQACIDRYGPLVWSLARRMCKDFTLSEDLVQEIFIQVWKSADRFDARLGTEPAFIATIARRRLIDAGRRSGRRIDFEVLHDDVASETDEGLHQLEVGEEAARATRALQILKPEQRKVLLLSIRDGLSHSQIASFMSLPLGTVKSHVRRGLERVSRALQVPELDAVEESAS